MPASASSSSRNSSDADSSRSGPTMKCSSLFTIIQRNSLAKSFTDCLEKKVVICSNSSFALEQILAKYFCSIFNTKSFSCYHRVSVFVSGFSAFLYRFFLVLDFYLILFSCYQPCNAYQYVSHFVRMFQGIQGNERDVSWENEKPTPQF